MSGSKSDIIARLQREILPLQGFKPVANNKLVDIGLGPVKQAFPNSEFPLGVVHEFCCEDSESASATGGFISALLSSIMMQDGFSLWISASRTIFPPALKSFGLDPEKIIFVDLCKEKDVLWAMEEALKCDGLAAVVAEMKELSFPVSRRLQLAVEQSHVTGFIIRSNPRSLNTTACITRWRIRPIPSVLEEGMPGVGFPRWNVELLRVRNGKPGSWEIEWKNGRLRHAYPFTSLVSEQQKKTG